MLAKRAVSMPLSLTICAKKDLLLLWASFWISAARCSGTSPLCTRRCAMPISTGAVLAVGIASLSRPLLQEKTGSENSLA